MTKVSVVDNSSKGSSIKLMSIPIGTYFKATFIGDHRIDSNEVLIKFVGAVGRISGSNTGGFFDCRDANHPCYEMDVIDYQPLENVEIILK